MFLNKYHRSNRIGKIDAYRKSKNVYRYKIFEKEMSWYQQLLPRAVSVLGKRAPKKSSTAAPHSSRAQCNQWCCTQRYKVGTIYWVSPFGGSTAFPLWTYTSFSHAVEQSASARLVSLTMQTKTMMAIVRYFSHFFSPHTCVSFLSN